MTPASTRPTELDVEHVRRVAKLARLALSDDRLTHLAGQLSSIVDAITTIRQADVQGVAPMAHVLPLVNVLRDDIAEPSLTTEQVLANAPASDGAFFAVPKILAADDQ